jgi:uncharacterized damage-inducible protein DinB
MKNIFEMYAHSFREKNETIYALLDKLSNDEREKDRGSYYKSLSALFQHVLFGQRLFMGLFQGALNKESAAVKALARLKNVSPSDGPMSEALWKELKTQMTEINTALVEFAAALLDEELQTPVAVPWYNGKPPQVPLSFLFHQLTAHTLHHSGQISQILDELNIENNYSSINAAFIPLG